MRRGLTVQTSEISLDPIASCRLTTCHPSSVINSFISCDGFFREFSVALFITELFGIQALVNI